MTTQKGGDWSMAYVLVRHKVEDYDEWRAAFYQYSDTRRDSGSQGARIFRDAKDPNELVVLLEWNNLEQARQFFQSEDLRQRMQRARVVGQPDIDFLEEVEFTSA
jgi:heme-degrading monooxygenase HmoA